MTDKLKTEGKFTYAQSGEGPAIVVLHGLMGALSNFEATFNHFSNNGYQVLIPELPLYSLSLIKTNVKNMAKFLKEFMEFKKLENAIIVGNSLGGHIGLYFTKHYPEKVRALVLTGSSGLYEKAMGDSFPKRGNYEYIEEKTRNVFYDPKIATKELVDDVFKIVNVRNAVIRLGNKFIDGTSFIQRHTNTKTTHLRNPIEGYNNDGAKPYIGITNATCSISNNIIGKNILLIDDIYTRTVNIDEDAIQALISKGANSVAFYAIGKTVFNH